MSYKIRRLLVLALCLTVSGTPGAPTQAGAPAQDALAAGDIIQAAGCSQTEVQAAIDAAGDGDFVLIPAGACAWTTPAAQTPAVAVDGKAVTVLGAGVGRTVISDSTGLNWNETLFRIDAAAGKPFRVSGLTVIGQGAEHYDSFAAISIYGTGDAFRVDHIRFDNIGGRSILVDGDVFGVIDHCEFIQPNGQGVIVSDNRGSPEGSTAWEEPLSYGTARAVYIEDSLFQWSSGEDGATDCGNGGRYVFRHNTVAGVTVGNHGMDSKPRSCMQMEIYDNTFVPVTHNIWYAIQSRGGTAIVFNNTLTGDYGMPIGVTNYRSCCYAGAACTPQPDPPHGDCNGSNPLDGNTQPQSAYKGWPCKDQIGRGTAQSSAPFYEWNNTFNGADVDVTVYNAWAGCTDPKPSDHIKENRDYFNDTPMPGYTPYTYPHPLTKDLVLHGTSADRTIRLNWEVRTILPPASVWQISYDVQTTAVTPITVTGILSPTRAYTLTPLTNYAWYTITLNAMLNDTPILTDTVRLMPTNRLIYLPLVLR